MARLGWRFRWGGLWAMLVVSGCVQREIVRPQQDFPTLLVARSGPRVILSWTSRPGESYTVMWAGSDERRANWRPLPGAVDIPGTGDVLQREDHVPVGEERYYRLLVEPGLRPVRPRV